MRFEMELIAVESIPESEKIPTAQYKNGIELIIGNPLRKYAT